MFHDDGASTEVTGSDVFVMASMTPENGSRTSPEKLKPMLESAQAFRSVRAHHGLCYQRWHPRRGEIPSTLMESHQQMVCSGLSAV